MQLTPDQVKGRIKSVAQKNKADARTLMRIYMMERFLERVAVSQYKDNFIIKGGMLVTAMVGVALRSTMDIDTKVCLSLQNRKTPVILVTKDIVVRVKAQMLGIQAEDFTTEQAPVSEEQYTGRCEVFVAEKKFEDFKKSILRRRMYIRWTKPVKSFL